MPLFSLTQTFLPFLTQAPEELCSHACAQQLELRFLRQSLQLYAVTSQKIQKETELLHASDQKGRGELNQKDVNKLKIHTKEAVFVCFYTVCIQ